MSSAEAAMSEELAREISELAPGTRLPSEKTLMNRFGVPRPVVRRVMDNLESRFLIRRRQGSGTFVNERLDYPLSFLGVHSVATTGEQSGAHGEMRVITSGTHPLPEYQSELMGITDPRSALRLIRIGHLNREPAFHTQDWIIPEEAQDLDVALTVFKSVSDAMRSFGYLPKRSRTVATVEDIPLQVRRHLRLDMPTPGWRVESALTDTESDQPLVASTTWFRLDSVRLIFDFP